MLVPISNAPRDYAWGDIGALAALEGREPSGRPEAEVWLGDHPGDPAEVDDGSGMTLDAWVGAHAGGAPLPFLLKLLAAASPLSIQAHPSIAQAREGFSREEASGVPRDAGHRNYRDENHKPEVIVALSAEFHALAGFRPADEIDALLAELGESDAEIRAVRERLAVPDPAEALRSFVGDVLTGAADPVVRAVAEAIDRPSSGPHARDIAAVREIARVYPGDRGIVVALLLNRVVLARGEALYVPAGMPHAYLSGLGVELMAASDNVLRGGLTPKHIDVPELLAVLDARPGRAPRLPARSEGPGVDVFAPPIDDFALVRVRRDDPSAAGSVVAVRGPAIALAVSGALVVTGDASAATLSPGRAVFVLAERELVVTGLGELFVAQPGQPSPPVSAS